MIYENEPRIDPAWLRPQQTARQTAMIKLTYRMQVAAAAALFCSLLLIGWTVERGYWRWFDIAIIAVNGGLCGLQLGIFLSQFRIRRWWRSIP